MPQLPNCKMLQNCQRIVDIKGWKWPRAAQFYNSSVKVFPDLPLLAAGRRRCLFSVPHHCASIFYCSGAQNRLDLPWFCALSPVTRVRLVSVTASEWLSYETLDSRCFWHYTVTGVIAYTDDLGLQSTERNEWRRFVEAFMRINFNTVLSGTRYTTKPGYYVFPRRTRFQSEHRVLIVYNVSLVIVEAVDIVWTRL